MILAVIREPAMGAMVFTCRNEVAGEGEEGKEGRGESPTWRWEEGGSGRHL